MSHGEMTWTSGLIPMIQPDAVTEILARVADIALVVSEAGRVMGVLSNPKSKIQLSFARWEGHALQHQLTTESIPKFEERLSDFVAGNGDAVRPVELNHPVGQGEPDFPVRYSFHLIGTRGAILMLGQDLRPVAEMQQQLVAAQIALEQDYEAQREHDIRLRVLMSAMREGALFSSAATGEVKDCNAAALSLLGMSRAAVIKHPLRDFLSVPHSHNLMEALINLADKETGAEINVTTRGGRELNLKATLFRAKSEQMLLCQISDRRGGTAKSDAFDDHLSALFERGSDGIVFVSRTGTVLSANDAVMQLTDVVSSKAIKGRPITDFLGRGTVDFNVIAENAMRTGTMRLYATRLVGEHGAETPVEIATTLLEDRSDPIFAMVIRDASRAEMVRKSNQQITDVDMRSVIELIGSQTLKGIVAKTTDVIEKMCIETAVELTSNNRVAAAEMLGLSRQSLYVKLRKYDLLKKDQEE
ncbi:MAG: transcriptional regulator PpsR [Pseudomonadota bacterium]